MFGTLSMFDDQVVSLSLAQVADIQDELYSIQETVRDNPVLSARIQHVIKKLNGHSARRAKLRSMLDIDEDQVSALGLSTLVQQAQLQCQQ